MKLLICLLLFICLISCSGPPENKSGNGTLTDSVPATTVSAQVQDNVILCEPSANFMALVTYMDSCSYKLDTSTISKTAEQFEHIALNKERYEESFLHRLLKDSATYEDGSQSLNSVPYDPKYDLAFAKATCIWTYSWKVPKKEDGIKREGTVEEWTFDSEASAKFACDFLNNEHRKIGFPFCKTASYYLQCGRYLYMFHSNRPAAEYPHRLFFKWLKKRCTRA